MKASVSGNGLCQPENEKTKYEAYLKVSTMKIEK
jgi:hypothetical protein